MVAAASNGSGKAGLLLSRGKGVNGELGRQKQKKTIENRYNFIISLGLQMPSKKVIIYTSKTKQNNFLRRWLEP